MCMHVCMYVCMMILFCVDLGFLLTYSLNVFLSFFDIFYLSFFPLSSLLVFTCVRAPGGDGHKDAFSRMTCLHKREQGKG